MTPSMGPRRAAFVAALATVLAALAPASSFASNGGAAIPTDGAPTAARASVRTGGAPDRPVPRPAPPHHLVHSAPVLPTPPGVAGASRFPLAAPHSYGGADARFGAARTGHIHQGQDVLAAERTPLVAPVPGLVAWRGNQPSGAGLYLVLHSSTRARDYVFMHLRPRSILVAAGEAVRVGQLLAQVGHTGDARGPHLHFEVWVGGWYAKGGHPVDPRPTLERWEH